MYIYIYTKNLLISELASFIQSHMFVKLLFNCSLCILDVQSLLGIGNLISATDLSENSDDNEEDDEDDSEKEDDEIKPTDNLLAVGHVFGDISILEVYGK